MSREYAETTVRVSRPENPMGFILEWLEKHYAGPISLESFTRLVDVSPRTLHRSFKKTLGMSPMNYVIDLRLRKAEEMLCGPGARVKEVAAKVGISDASYFSRIFRKRTGPEPSAYRAEQGHARNAYAPKRTEVCDF